MNYNYDYPKGSQSKIYDKKINSYKKYYDEPCSKLQHSITRIRDMNIDLTMSNFHNMNVPKKSKANINKYNHAVNKNHQNMDQRYAKKKKFNHSNNKSTNYVRNLNSVIYPSINSSSLDKNEKAIHEINSHNNFTSLRNNDQRLTSNTFYQDGLTYLSPDK